MKLGIESHKQGKELTLFWKGQDLPAKSYLCLYVIEKSDLQPDFNIDNKNNPFFQKKVVFTGDLVTYSRKEAAHCIKLLGADVNTSISKNTDFVIIGRNPGPSKIEKISQLGIPIISENDFLKMLE